jgi:hypothetical protein
MAILSKGATIVADTQVSATNLNNLVDAATFVSGAVDGTTTQLSGGAIIVKDGGITPAKLSTGGPSWTTGGVVSATSFSGPITGNITASIADITLLDLTPELGYPTSGTITLNLAAASNAKIELGGNSTFALSSIASGYINIVALRNVTAGTITTAWPAWISAGGSFPASLTAGQAMVVSLYSYGTTTGSVYAVSSL